MRVLLAIALKEGYAIVTGEFSVAFMHTPIPDDELIVIEPPKEIEPNPDVVWRLRRGLNGLVSASQRFQKYLFGILVVKPSFTQCVACPTLLWQKESNIRVSVHVDEPLAVGVYETVCTFCEHLGKWLMTKVSEAMNGTDPTIYLGSRYWRFNDEIVEAPKDKYWEEFGEVITDNRSVSTPGVRMHAKNAKDLEYVGKERHPSVSEGHWKVPVQIGQEA